MVTVGRGVAAEAAPETVPVSLFLPRVGQRNARAQCGEHTVGAAGGGAVGAMLLPTRADCEAERVADAEGVGSGETKGGALGRGDRVAEPGDVALAVASSEEGAVLLIRGLREAEGVLLCEAGAEGEPLPEAARSGARRLQRGESLQRRGRRQCCLRKGGACYPL